MASAIWDEKDQRWFFVCLLMAKGKSLPAPLLVSLANVK